MHGGAGNDRLWGGAGSDLFVFNQQNLGHDRIEDWTSEDQLYIWTGGSTSYAQQSDGVLIDHGQGTVLVVGADIGEFLI